MQGLALVSALPQTRGVSLAPQPPPHGETSCSIAKGSTVPGDGGCSMSPPWKRAGTCKPTALLWVTYSLGSLTNIPRGCGATWAVSGRREEVRPWWDFEGSMSQGCRAGCRQLALPQRAERRKFLRHPNGHGGCKWLLQSRQPPVPSPGGCGAAAGCQPPSRPSQRGKIPHSLSQEKRLSAAVSPERCVPSGSPDKPQLHGAGPGKGHIWHRLGFFRASQPNLSAFCFRHLDKVLPT